MIRFRVRSSRLVFSALTSSIALVAGCGPSPGAESSEAKAPGYQPHPELVNVRLFVPTKAELTWTDNDCAPKVDALASQFAQEVSGALSRVGFTVVGTEASADARVRVRANLTYCGVGGYHGPGSVAIEPGAVASGNVGRNNGLSESQFWAGHLAVKLADAPQVLALARKRAQPAPAENAVAPTPPAPTPPAPAALPATVAAPAAPPPAPAVSPAFASGAQQSNAYALVVGIEKYRDVPAPPGARSDAETFRTLATKTLGVPEANVRSLLDDHASKADLERELAWLKNNVPRDGTVFFFFAGHGAPDAGSGTAYILPYDGSPDAVAQTGAPLASVLQGLSETKAKHVVAFVDACFSGAGGRSVLPKGARPLVRVKEAASVARVALFAAASGAQISGPTSDGKAGLFTRTLADAIGGAQADIDGDGAVTLEELSQWATPRVAREAQRQNREQRPSLTLPSGAVASTFTVAYGITKP